MKINTTTTVSVLGAALLLSGAVSGQRNNRGSNADVWKYLAGKYDADQDGKITTKEYPRGTQKFGAYDTNGDGVLDASDFQSNGRRRNGRRGGGRRNEVDPAVTFVVAVAKALAAQADADRSGGVSKTEWDAALLGLDRNQDSVLDAGELTQLVRAALGRGKVSERAVGRRARHLDSNGDGRVQSAELGSRFATLDRDGDQKLAAAEWAAAKPRRAGPPRVGELAPDFDLPLVASPKKSVRLSSFRGSKPVALIFGSYT